MFIGRTDVEAETPILWPPDVKSQLIGKDPDAGKDFRQEEKGMTEDEMIRWHHRLNGHESEQTLGDSEGQGSLTYCKSMGLQRVRHNLVTEQQGSSVCGILQAGILEWVAISFARVSSQLRDRTVLRLCRWILHRLNHQGSPCVSL